MGAEFIDYTGRQWLLGANDGQRNFVFLSPLAQRLHIGNSDIFKLRVQRRTTVSRSDVHRLHPGGLRQFPGQSVLTATTTNHQNFHVSFNLKNSR